LSASQVSANTYFALGQSDQCGTYFEASYRIDEDNSANYFPGGEAGSVKLVNPVLVKGLETVLYDGVIVEEGVNESLGRVQVTPSRYANDEVLIVTSEYGTFIYQKCP